MYLKTTSPQYNGSISVDGINNQVDIHFDEFGIPHIYGQNSEDVYFALGYVQAQDRIFQMEIIRRLVSGKMSEILGPQLLPTDKHLLTLGLRESAEQSAEKYLSSSSSDYQKACKAYLKGINYYQDNSNTPVEFLMLGIKKQPFVEADIYSTLAYMSLGFSAAINEEPYVDFVNSQLGEDYLKDWHVNTGVQRLLDSTIVSQVNDMEQFPMNLPSIKSILKDLAMPLWTGSNGWVVSAERSKSGKVLLANDTHIAHSQPAIWYEAHLNYPGFEFYGNFLATVPFGVVGHNRKLGWGLTIFPLDNLDLYQEKSNPANKQEVWVDDHWQKMKVRKEIIKVKGGADVDFEVNYSRHGAIINEIDPLLKTNNEPVALSWEATRKPTQAMEALYMLNKAQNIEAFQAALPMVDIIGLNVLYGDVEDNIAWWATGKMPKHKNGVNSKLLLDGASGAHELEGYYDFADNPHKINPSSGFIASANNEPYPSVADGIMYPGYYCPSNRFERITTLLSEKKMWSKEEFKALQLDVKSYYHEDNTKLIHHILTSKPGLPTGQFTKEVLAVMDTWDGNYNYISKGPLVYQKMIFHIMEQAVKDELPSDSYKKIIGTYLFKNTIPKLLSSADSPWWDDKTTEQRESRYDIVLRAFKQSLIELRKQCGSDVSSWKWEDHHTMTHVHPIGMKKPFDKVFNVGPFAVEGGNGVPNKLEFVNNAKGNYDVVSGAALRVLLDFNNVEASENIIPTGQSGNVMSPHYDDQAKMYAEGKYRTQLMNKKAIEQQSKKLILIQKK